MTSLSASFKNNCGGSAWEDYCGECVDTTQTNAIWNDTSIGTCEIIAEANTIKECVGDSANYKLWGRWDEVNEICYCPLKAGIMYDPNDFISSITTISEVGNFVNNCGLCVKIGSGNTNVGGCD